MSQPPKLGANLIVRKEEVPTTVRPPQPTHATGPKMMVSYRPTAAVYEELREISHKERRPMQSLIDEAVELWLSRRK